ncbi:MAG: type II secretion system minor pseudopilin GspI [Gammaproteobacteria bacterium]|nr:type II secretion system minor pseudopilin GspI [Gammaproteobacteria bacterium]
MTDGVRDDKSGVRDDKSGVRDDKLGVRDGGDCRVQGGGDRRVRAFTLIEVMIALLVIAIGMGAVINTTGESGWKSAVLRQKTIASWVAQNQIALYRAKRTWGSTKPKSGVVEMANVKWAWEMKISTTDDPSLRRLDVDVSLKDDSDIKASLTGFIARL